MRKYRPRLRAYVLAVYVLALLTLLLGAGIEMPRPPDPMLTAILFVLASVARTRPVHVGPKTKMTVEETATFAATLLLAPELAGLIAGVSSLVGGLAVRKRSVYNRLFNASAATIATTAGAITFRLLAPGDAALLSQPVAILAAATVSYLLRTEIVDAAVAFQIGRRFFASWWPDHRRDIGQQAALFVLGTLAAVSSAAHPWALLLFAFPMFFVLLSLRETTRMRAQTKAAIVELADMIDRRDRYTYGHSMRVAAYANRLAGRLGLSPAQVDLVTEAARVHDIGKIMVPDAVLQKPGPLNVDEREIMRQHCDAGHELLRTLPEFWEGAHMVLSHHERHDGHGYPKGLRGNELPIEVSIIAVCDAYDAMSSDRVYRKALPWSRIEEELLGGRDTQWAAQAVTGLIGMLEEDRRAAHVVAPAGMPVPVRA